MSEEIDRLTPREKALVAVATLLDGREAEAYIEFDATRGLELRAAAEVLGTLVPDLRMPMAGTLLREALQELKG